MIRRALGTSLRSDSRDGNDNVSGSFPAEEVVINDVSSRDRDVPSKLSSMDEGIGLWIASECS